MSEGTPIPIKYGDNRVVVKDLVWLWSSDGPGVTFKPTPVYVLGNGLLQFRDAAPTAKPLPLNALRASEPKR